MVAELKKENYEYTFLQLRDLQIYLPPWLPLKTITKVSHPQSNTPDEITHILTNNYSVTTHAGEDKAEPASVEQLNNKPAITASVAAT